jgi:hypothetical protein
MLRRRELYKVFLNYTTTDEEYQIASNMYVSMVGSKMPDSQIELSLAQTIVDGLTWGNWPWKTKPIKDAEAVNPIVDSTAKT